MCWCVYLLCTQQPGGSDIPGVTTVPSLSSGDLQPPRQWKWIIMEDPHQSVNRSGSIYNQQLPLVTHQHDSAWSLQPHTSVTSCLLWLWPQQQVTFTTAAYCLLMVRNTTPTAIKVDWWLETVRCSEIWCGIKRVKCTERATRLFRKSTADTDNRGGRHRTRHIWACR